MGFGHPAQQLEGPILICTTKPITDRTHCRFFVFVLVFEQV